MKKKFYKLGNTDLYEPDGKKTYRHYDSKTRRTSYDEEFFGTESKELKEMLGINKKTNTGQIEKLKKIIPKIIEGELTELQQRCVRAYYFEGVNMIEISQQEGVSPQAVSACIKRGNNRIKRILKYYF